MKTLPLLAAFALLPLVTARAQSPAVASEIAGFVRLDMAGASASGPQLSFKSVGLVRPADYKGYGTIINPTTLRDATGTWENGDFNPPAATAESATHYLEITAGPRAGLTFDILATNGTAHTLTIAQELPGDLGTATSFCIRKYWTLGSLFGAQNEAGLQAGTALTADKILIYNGDAYDTFYYSNDQLAGTGWRRVGDGARDHAGRKFYPEDGLMIRRAGGGEVRRLVKGVARTGTTSIPVQPGMNLLGNVYAAPMTLASCRLYTGNPVTGVRAGDAAAADQVMIFNGTTYDSYYYSLATSFTPGWRKTGDPTTDRSATEIPAGGALVLKRGGATGFDWKVPAHPLVP